MSDPQKDVHASVVSALGSIGLATLASRVLGYARDMVVARAFGAGPVTDAFFVAFRIPNLLRRLLAEGALSTAIIPVFSAYLAREAAPSVVRMLRAVAGASVVTLTAVSALGVLAAPWIVAVMAPGWAADASLSALAVRLTRVMFPYILLVGLGALAAGILNAHHRFLAPALGPAVLNVGMIAAVLIGYVIASGVSLSMLSRASERTFFLPLGLHANGVGRLLAAAYALLLFPWWETKRAGLKLFLFATMGVLTFALLLTFSRGAFTGFIVVNLLFLAWKFNLRSVGLAALALVVAMLFMPGYVIDRVMVGFDSGSADAVSAGRIEGIWLPLLPELARSPLWGNGLGSIMWLLPMKIGAVLEVTHPHNAYLEALLDMGLIGLALMLLYFWHVWRGFLALGGNPWLSPEMRGLFQGGAAALVCFLVTGMAGSSLRPDPDFIYLWLAIGLMYGMMARKPAG